MAKKWVQLGMMGLLMFGCSRQDLNNPFQTVTDGPRGGGDMPGIPKVAAIFTGNQYGGCSDYSVEIQNAAQEAQNEYKKLISSYSNSTGSAEKSSAQNDAAAPTASAGASGNVETNVQVGGVDESDGFKSSAHHIFVVNKNGSIEVLNRATLAKIGRLELGNYIPTLYVSDNKLIVLGNDNSEYDNPKFSVTVYNLEDGKLPTQSFKKTMAGYFSESRLKQNELQIISNVYLTKGNIYANNEKIEIKPKLVREKGKIADIPCAQIAEVKFKDPDLNVVSSSSSDYYVASSKYYSLSSMTRISMFDLNNLTSEALHFGVPGNFQGRNMYVSSNAIYLVNDDYSQTSILKVKGSAKSQKISTTIGLVEGRIKDRWAMHEYVDGEHFAIATTTGELWSHGSNAAKNHLFILKGTDGILSPVGQVNDFGLHEDIRAIRYLNNMAYVVTFKKTDPLFAIDIADPTAPKILGELKIPGFSTYLHPFSNNLMVGVGFDAADQGDFAYYQGIQVSLFDTTDPTKLERLDVKIHGERGSFSDATSDAHAFFPRDAKNVFALPITEYVSATTTQPRNPWEYGAKYSASGAVFYSIADRNLKRVNRLSDMDLHTGSVENNNSWWSNQSQSSDVNRIAELDGRIVTVSDYAVRAYDAEAVYRGDAVKPLSEYKRERILTKSEGWCGTPPPSGLIVD